MSPLKPTRGMRDYALKWLQEVLPKHIPHEYADHMAQPSHIYPIPMIFKNEAKYEDCVDIMDHYERELLNLFEKAHGKLILF